jgi:hypothetical protein
MTPDELYALAKDTNSDKPTPDEVFHLGEDEVIASLCQAISEGEVAWWVDPYLPDDLSDVFPNLQERVRATTFETQERRHREARQQRRKKAAEQAAR